MISLTSITKEDAVTCVGEGWVSLVERFYEKARRSTLPVTVLQVKEKFGCLRIYWVVEGEKLAFSDRKYKALSQFLFKLEAESKNICEHCGANGTMYQHGGWIKTCCDSCYKEWIGT